jgi:hypothetical protein
VSTFVDAVGALRSWINAQTATLVGAGNPLQKGAHLHHLVGARPAVYALLEELPSRHSDDSPEDPDMIAVVSFQVYGDTREAATAGAVALAEALTSLTGTPALVEGATLQAADDVQGPSWIPDGDTPRLILQATVRMSPA